MTLTSCFHIVGHKNVGVLFDELFQLHSLDGSACWFRLLQLSPTDITGGEVCLPAILGCLVQQEFTARWFIMMISRSFSKVKVISQRLCRE